MAASYRSTPSTSPDVVLPIKHWECASPQLSGMLKRRRRSRSTSSDASTFSFGPTIDDLPDKTLAYILALSKGTGTGCACGPENVHLKGYHLTEIC